MTTSVVDVAVYLQSLIEANQNALSIPNNGIYYGDQQRIPVTPCVCIETGDKSSQLNGAPRRVMTTMTNYILVYHSKVASVEDNRKNDDLFAEAVEDLVHADASMGGLVIDSLVTSIEYGYQMRSNTLFRASRLTVEARQQEQLPSS